MNSPSKTTTSIPSSRLGALSRIFLLLLASLWTTSAQTPLTSGKAVQGEITANGQKDSYTFQANQGDTFIVRAGEIAVSKDIRPLLRVAGPDGLELGKSQGLNDAEVTAKVTVSGLQTVTFESALGTGRGTYRLEQLTIPGPVTIASGDDGGPIESGQTLEAELPVGDLDAWTFSANSGDSIVVRAGEITVIGDLRPWVRLYGPNGILLGSNEGLGHAEVSFRATNGGPYRIVVASAISGGAGTYRVSLARTGTSPVITAEDGGGPLGNGESREATLPVGDLDVWTFNAIAGETVVVRMGEVAVVGDLRPSLKLYGPSGALLATDTGLAHAEVSITASNAGPYVVVAAATVDGGSGTYRISLAKRSGDLVLHDGDEGGSISNGESKIASLPVGDLDVWTFQAGAGENVVIRMGEITVVGDLRPDLRLLDPSGVQVARDQALSDAQISFQTTTAGLYTVVASALVDGGSGTYRLSLARATGAIVLLPGDEGGPLANGELRTASLEVGDLDVWTFEAVAGESVVVRMGEISVVGDLRPDIRLLDPTGAQLARDQAVGDAEVSVRVTLPGRYTVIACATVEGGAGTYRINLAKTAEAIVVSPGDEGGLLTNGLTQEATLTVGDLDVWTFNAQAGDNLLLRMGEKTVAGDLRPDLRLYGPTGLLVARRQDVGDAEISFRATNSGPYTVISSATSESGSGTYRLHFVQAPAPLSISPGEDGGPLTNGASIPAVLKIGDLDVWSFNAGAGDSVILRAGEVKVVGDIRPTLRLYGPDGALVAHDEALQVAEIATRLTKPGTYQVVVSATISSGSGDYQLHFAQIPGTFAVSAGDEGGFVAPGTTPAGRLDYGDLDPWVFTACVGEQIVIRAQAQPGSTNLAPQIRLYGRDGTPLGSAVGATTSTLTVRAPATGDYTVVINDGSSAQVGTGPYLLSLGGFYHGTRLCIAQTTPPGAVSLELGGGVPNSEFVLLSTFDINTPLSQWSPVLTNHLGNFGEFNLLRVLTPGTDQEYFRFRQP